MYLLGNFTILETGLNISLLVAGGGSATSQGGSRPLMPARNSSASRPSTLNPAGTRLSFYSQGRCAMKKRRKWRRTRIASGSCRGACWSHPRCRPERVRLEAAARVLSLKSTLIPPHERGCLERVPKGGGVAQRPGSARWHCIPRSLISVTVSMAFLAFVVHRRIHCGRGSTRELGVVSLQVVWVLTPPGTALRLASALPGTTLPMHWQ